MLITTLAPEGLQFGHTHHKPALLRREMISFWPSPETGLTALLTGSEIAVPYGRLSCCSSAAPGLPGAETINCTPDSRFQPGKPRSFRLCCLAFAKCSHLTGAVHTSLGREVIHVKPLKRAKAIFLPGAEHALLPLCW